MWSVPGIFYMGESGCLIEFSVAELVIYSKKFLKSNAHVDTKQSFMIKLANLIWNMFRNMYSLNQRSPLHMAVKEGHIRR